MGSIPSTSNGLSDLMQTLKNENSPLLSTLSSPNVQKALENAPAGDIVQLSDQAMQLQSVDALFGTPNATTSPTDSLFSALANIGSSANSSASGSSLNPGSSLADQMAAYQGNLQAQDTQALFGTGASTMTQSSQYDVFA